MKFEQDNLPAVMELYNTHGMWKPILVVFGHVDDTEACAELAGAMAVKYTARQYRCRSLR